MFNSPDDRTESAFKSGLIRYGTALAAIEESGPNSPSLEQVLEVMSARDALSAIGNPGVEVAGESLVKLLDLDQRLKAQSEAIASDGKLENSRPTFNPPDSNWWWFLTVPQTTPQWKRFDWIWDSLTAGALVLAGSFMINTIQAFSSGGLGVSEAFSSIAQVAGLGALSKGVLTSDGQDKVKGFLFKLNIPEPFHNPAIFMASGMLTVGSYGLNNSLPYIGSIYYEQGINHYEEGDLNEAHEKYLNASKLDPENIEVKVALGVIYESLGSLDLALEQYKQGIQYGNAQAFNNAGRTYIQKFNPGTPQNEYKIAESLLILGLQRVDPQETNLQYQLHKNLGWSLLKQQEYDRAEQELKEAIAFDDEILNSQVGGGMAYCMLAEVYQQQKRRAEALEQWQFCAEYARPETLYEYKWFLEVGQKNLAQQIDTSSVVATPHHAESPGQGNTNLNVEELIQMPPQVIEGEEASDYSPEPSPGNPGE
ncbi:tetratricopeptide repeat protein [Laspinema sp. D1]|uniref:Tetratricopeptide repeat protein n=1 Tax=Laspinema palackyanum D2a TaxID=2953684 RepID=A0ABT2MKJ8_9CYAN|nr:tetratricopeptide repeat protein [Laspinema sp. D2b]MCT7965270.1 tetratricopeptide repeat protein [Laspinema sp. D2a]